MKTSRLFYTIALLALVIVLVACTPRGIAGIDYHIRESGMTFQFYAVTLTTSPTVIGDHTFSPDAGDAALIVHGYYTGDFEKYQDKVPGRNEELFLITDAKGTQWIRNAIYMDKSDSKLTMDIAFIIPSTSPAPYILSSNIGKTWSVDITSLVNNQLSGNEATLTNMTPAIAPDISSILRANDYSEVENNSLFYCPDGCKVLTNTNTNTQVAIYDNGIVIVGISPLDFAVTFSDDQLDAFASILAQIYGPDMENWLQNTLLDMKATLGYSGDSTGIVNGFRVELKCAWKEGKTNIFSLTIDPTTQP